MERVADQLGELAPALAFLLAAVPLAALLDRLGFFSSLAEVVVARSPRGVPVVVLWWVAALTTVVLNLDTTIVLLTPLYVRLARRTGADPVGLALVPLLLASLASSVLPVSNLTTLIAAEQLGLSTADVIGHLGAPSLAAVVVGWWAYRRRHPARLDPVNPAPIDARALRIGGAVVVALLVAFVVGPSVGVAPWIAALVADVVLVAVTRHVPWRTLPVVTAAGVAAVAALVAAVVPERVAHELAQPRGAVGLAAVSVLGAATAGVVNNLPALLLALGGSTRAGWPTWAWLLGVDAGAVLAPFGALANLLWLQLMRDEGTPVGWGRYVRVVVPVAAPAFVVAVAVLVGQHALA